VLIINHNYYPAEMAGTIRIRGLVKYLPRFGWSVKVLTSNDGFLMGEAIPPEVLIAKSVSTSTAIKAKLGLINEVRSPAVNSSNTRGNVLGSKIWNLGEEVLTYPDPFHIWRGKALAKARELLDAGNTIDAIISSSPPIASHLVARDLKREYGIPWIAELRDLWSQCHYYKYSKVRNWMDSSLERRTLGLADAVVTVSEPWAEKLGHRLGRKVYAISNGFDPDNLNPGVPLRPGFTITYTGGLVLGRLQDPAPLFRTLMDLFKEGEMERKGVKVEFYGRFDSWLAEEVKKYDLGDVVTIHSSVSRVRSIELQRSSQVLLNITWDDPEETGLLTAKTFDYLAAQRPILSIGRSPGAVGDVLTRTGAGAHFSNDTDLRYHLTKLYSTQKLKGKVSYPANSSEIKRYSQNVMAKEYSELLSKLIK
jgi:hypothetical protein